MVKKNFDKSILKTEMAKCPNVMEYTTLKERQHMTVKKVAKTPQKVNAKSCKHMSSNAKKTTSATKFKVGDTVTWSSSSSGTTSTKKGQVVAIVQKGASPFNKITKKMQRECALAFKCDSVRNHQSYLIRVSRGEGRKDFIYFPRVSLLHVL
jgi:altronate dehydratase